ncbi:MAG TPA: DUF4252 domain-containing protein [Paludibacter sp.]|nr:DUF4252 domain-containing protein [Paludibacter sp.]
MKRVLFLSVIMCIFIGGIKAQTVNRLFQKYDDDCRFECISVGKFLFNLALLSGNVKGEERELIAGLQKIKILTTKNDVEPELTSRIMHDLQKVIRRGDFENLVEVREKGERVNIYTRMSRDYYTDLLIAVKDQGEISLIWINGKLPFHLIEKLQHENYNQTLANLPINIK